MTDHDASAQIPGRLKQDRRHQFSVAVALALMVAVIWALRHRYAGIVGDAQLYAFQALARLQPALASDLALQHGSQDSYTIFSPAYAWLIEQIGLPAAALTGVLTCTCGFLAGAWLMVRALATREIAFLSVALLCTVLSSYGSAGVFNYIDDYFTARSAAEALVVLALACHLHGRRLPAFFIAGCALAIHPLMALPGVLLLGCLTVSTRIALLGALAGLLGVLGLAVIASQAAPANSFLPLMDPAWLEVVRERSQFLFLDLWSTRDWELNARPFLSLLATLTVATDPRIRKLALSAWLVGGAGLAVAFIAGTLGPVAILVQGQAWRWVWITNLVSILLLVPTLALAWREKRGGRLCAVLLLSAWLVPRSIALALFACVPAIWLLRPALTAAICRYLRWTAALAAAALLVWASVNCWSIVHVAASNGEHAFPVLTKLSNCFELGVPAVLFVALVTWILHKGQSEWLPWVVSACLVGCLAGILPFTLRAQTPPVSAADIAEFSDWIRTIPPTSTVYVPSFKDNGLFVWLTLGRANYLSTNQSSGVVFSRPIAMEIARRSAVLLPLEDPNWKILTRLTKSRANPAKKAPPNWRPLTAQRLELVCTDPLLGFVVARERIGFGSLTHTQPGIWNGWNLYDCNRVRSAARTP